MLINRGNIIVLFLLTGVLSLYSCVGSDLTGPEKPEIEMLTVSLAKNPLGYDTLVSVTFKYADGNGDLGYAPGDTFSPFDTSSSFFYNLQTEYEQVVDGVFKPVTIFGQPVKLDERFESLTPSGKNKAIKGEMTLRFPAAVFGADEQPDSIRVKIKITDRALNVSNQISTDVIYLNQAP